MPPALIDTDILIELLKGKNAVVASNSAAYLAQYGGFAFSAMTRYEIQRGILEKQAILQQQKFQTFCVHSVVFPITDAILDHAAQLWVESRKLGFPGQDADLIIAATAMSAGRALVTGNTPHFAWISGLNVTNWRI